MPWQVLQQQTFPVHSLFLDILGTVIQLDGDALVSRSFNCEQYLANTTGADLLANVIVLIKLGNA